MVVGYLYQIEPMDLHAWFEAYIGGRWFTFDGTQNIPRGNRISIGYGRDAADVALTSNYGALELKSMEVTVEWQGTYLNIAGDRNSAWTSRRAVRFYGRVPRVETLGSLFLKRRALKGLW
jgi:transglutaminase-like putative cysteine protease